MTGSMTRLTPGAMLTTTAMGRPVLPVMQTGTVLLVSPDTFLRERLRLQLSAMRWTVLEAAGGAEALLLLDTQYPAAVLLDGWLPDLEATEFARALRLQFPAMDLLHLDGTVTPGTPKAARRHELLHALREVQDDNGANAPAWSSAPEAIPPLVPRAVAGAYEAANASTGAGTGTDRNTEVVAAEYARREQGMRTVAPAVAELVEAARSVASEPVFALPELVGEAPAMQELARMIRLVAPRSATVLIEGETGSGKELVAKAVHRLSDRAGKPFAVLNCAAIPETLLEAELFGHTRGAFTGAVASRKGRIEAAHGGTLFLDEIGEMPLALQAKMLRFLECGELQKIGENELSRVDVRIVAATHQPLEQRCAEGTFRMDLYHRLAVFPVEVPSLRERVEDLPMLVTFLLRKLGERMPTRRISGEAMALLQSYAWPGNVRELMHVLERASILTGDAAEIGVNEIRLRGQRR